MTKVPFFTPICFGIHPKSTRELLLEAVDNYFYLRGKKAEVISKSQSNINTKLFEFTPLPFETIAKVASYFTLVLPLILLGVKAILRSNYNFHHTTQPVSAKDRAITLKARANALGIKIDTLQQEAIEQRVKAQEAADFNLFFDAVLKAIPKKAALPLQKELATLQKELATLQGVQRAERGRIWMLRIDGLLKKIIILNLKGLGLKTLPPEISSLTGLNQLGLEGNQLEFLPAEITNLTLLQYLDLSHNRFAVLPANLLSRFTQLEGLGLSHNQFTSIPVSALPSLTRLRRLNLSHNQLASVPAKAFQSLTRLEELDLSHNQLTSIPENLFQSLTQLTFLDLSHNQLTSLPENLFQSLTQLTFLDLSHNQLTSIPQNLFRFLDQLTFLVLSFNQLTSIPENALQNLKRMQGICLHNNKANIGIPLRC